MSLELQYLALNREACENADSADPLRKWKEAFYIPKDLIYLDGNSLGPLPKKAQEYLKTAIEQEWAEDLITSWNKAGWWNLPEKLGEMIAQLLGAEANQVIVSDSTSINLYKVLHAAMCLRADRNVLVSEQDSFPTDLYMMAGIAGNDENIKRHLIGKDGENLEDLLNDKVGVVVISHVNYRTGELLPIPEMVRKTHAAGSLFVLDVCHSAGILPIELDEWGVDFAVGCTYKYLNGGPGAPAFLYVAKQHQNQAKNPLSGWLGHAKPFAFSPHYQPADGVQRFKTGTQPILSMRAMQAGLEIATLANMLQIRAKSLRLTQLFMEIAKKQWQPFGISVKTPYDVEQRGSQVALEFENGYAVIQALIEQKVIGDFREPGIMRFGFAPLYLSYVDVWDAAVKLTQILAQETWREERFQQKSAVT